MTTLETRNCRLVQARDPKQPVPYARSSCVRRVEQVWNRSLRSYVISILGDLQDSTRQNYSQPDLMLETILLWAFPTLICLIAFIWTPKGARWPYRALKKKNIAQYNSIFLKKKSQVDSMLKEKILNKISTLTSYIFPASMEQCEQHFSSSYIQIIKSNLEQKALKHLAQ